MLKPVVSVKDFVSIRWRSIIGNFPAGHMKSSLPYCAFIVTAFAAAGLAVFHANARATLTSQPQGESFKSGGLRSFEIVPLETVSETSANASIGDLNGDGHPDIVLAKGRHWEVPSRIFLATAKETSRRGRLFRVRPPRPTRRPWPI